MPAPPSTTTTWRTIAHPIRNRLIGIAVAPTHDVDWAVNELQRVRKLGFRGAMINTVPPEGCPPFRDKSYDKLWAAVGELELPLTMHILTGRVLDPISYAETEDEYAEAPGKFLDAYDEIRHVLANDFIFGGIFDRFPKLKLTTGEFELGWGAAFCQPNRSDADRLQRRDQDADAPTPSQRLYAYACVARDVSTTMPVTSSFRS